MAATHVDLEISVVDEAVEGLDRQDIRSFHQKTRQVRDDVVDGLNQFGAEELATVLKVMAPSFTR